MIHNRSIGIFDSGVGGISIWKEIHHLLPNENTIYLADSKNAPYGNKSVDDIISLSIKNTEILIEKGAKIIVVACNTATTNAIEILRNKFDIPIIGIEPAIKPAALQTKSKSIGILATRGTLSSKLFNTTSKEFTNGITLIEVIGEGLVSLIEEGKLYSTDMTNLLKVYIDSLLNKNIDYLVLGCTHYPFLIPQIKALIPPHITIIDSGAAVAKQTQSILENLQLLNPNNSIPELEFFSNKDTITLKLLLKEFKEDSTISTIDF